jgi:hypothetical protein
MADDNGGTPQTETQDKAAETAPLLAPGSFADGSQEGDPADWQPPQVNEQGFAVDGDGIPINLRLRSLHLADAGKAEDPGGQVSPEAITAAVDQLATYDAAYPSLSGMRKADLVKQAERESVQLRGDELADEIASAITAARPARIG